MYGIDNIPIVREGDDIADLIFESGFELKKDDILVIAQKIISKAEGRVVNLRDVQPSNEAIELSRLTGRPADFCQVVIDESKSILAVKGRTIVTESRNGMKLTSAGIDKSNIEGDGNLVLLPEDSDISASRIRRNIIARTNFNVAVIINDSLGREDRHGSIGNAIGLSGISGIKREDTEDLHGRRMTPMINIADEISSAASILMGQSNNGIPIVILRGVQYHVDENSSINDLIINNETNTQ